MTVEYAGEALWISKVGHVLTILSFVSVAFSSFAYYFATEFKDDGWKKIGALSFRTHSLAVASLVGLLFYMLLNHHYEYLYVFKHSNDIMPLKYILSCFWAGQEGSFLLWIICHVILGNILQLTAKTWEAPAMTIFALVQAFLNSMLLGIYIPEGIGGGVLIGILSLLGVALLYHKIPKSQKITFLAGAIAIGAITAYFGLPDFQIGSNPFVLLTRDSEKLFDNEAFINTRYAELIQGQGLNPLLQNYWMTIHPPTLFLGFASTLIPFCFAIAGLWQKKLNEWMNPTLPWIYLGIMVLGTGILMGGAWAYESLTFGGFWAWDPVENASLFPWITFVGAAHVMIVQRKRGKSSYLTFLLTLFSFLFVVYSTYLTRSGVLAETSVHSFASGSSGQIILFLCFMYWLSGMILLQGKITRAVFSALIVVIAYLNGAIEETTIINIILISGILGVFVWDYYSFFDKGDNADDHFSSREFWMTIGAIALMISCLQLIIKTSLPVINAIFDLNKVLNKTEIVTDYALPQMAIGTAICFIMGFGLFLKFKKTPGKPFWKHFGLAALISLVITIGGIVFTDFNFGDYSINYLLYPLFFWASLITIIGNAWHFVVFGKLKIKKSGAAIAHLGFGMIMLGSFISTSQSEVISSNKSSFDISEQSGGELSNEENIKLDKGDTIPMNGYLLNFKNKYQEHVNVYYEIDYFKELENGSLEKEFTLSPFIQTNETFGRVSEPDTRHFLWYDIYTHITSASTDTAKAKDEYRDFSTITIQKGGSGIYKDLIVQYDTIKHFKTVELADSIELHVSLIRNKNEIGSFALPYVIYKDKVFPIPVKSDKLQMVAELAKISPEDNSFTLYMAEIENTDNDYLIMKAIKFPLMNILWLGCIIMIIGTLLAVIHRIQLSKKKTANEVSRNT
jgi:cytochrome c-type biogenesis protein CcmF